MQIFYTDFYFLSIVRRSQKVQEKSSGANDYTI